MLNAGFSNYPKGALQSSIMKSLLGEGIFAVDGVKWEKQRKVASYMFSQASLKYVSPQVDEGWVFGYRYMTYVFGEHAKEVRASTHADLQALLKSFLLWMIVEHYLR